MKRITSIFTGLLLPLSFFVNGQTTMSKTYQYIVNGVSFSMVEVSEGTYTMGATSEQGDDNLVESKPTHRVSLDKYQIGQTEVTQSLWQAVMGSNPSKVKGEQLPVTNVSWNDCQNFILKLNALTGKNFRLPTEAEWEYAARGGQNSRRYTYSGSNNISPLHGIPQIPRIPFGVSLPRKQTNWGYTICVEMSASGVMIGSAIMKAVLKIILTAWQQASAALSAVAVMLIFLTTAVSLIDNIKKQHIQMRDWASD